MKNFKQIRKEIAEGVKDLKNYKDRDRKGHEAYMNIHVVKGNSSNKFNDDFGFNQKEMDMMDNDMVLLPLPLPLSPKNEIDYVLNINEDINIMVKDPELERLRIQIVEIGIKTLSFIIR